MASSKPSGQVARDRPSASRLRGQRCSSPGPSGRAALALTGSRDRPRSRLSAVCYLVEATGGGESPFVYESEAAPEVGATIFDRSEGVVHSHAYAVRFIEPGRDDYDGVIKADWIGEGWTAASRVPPLASTAVGPSLRRDLRAKQACRGRDHLGRIAKRS